MLRRANVALVIWFCRAVGVDLEAVRVEEGVEAAGFPEECVGLGHGRAFVRSAVCLQCGLECHEQGVEAGKKDKEKRARSARLNGKETACGGITSPVSSVSHISNSTRLLASCS